MSECWEGRKRCSECDLEPNDVIALVQSVFDVWLPRHPCDEKTKWHVQNYMSDLVHVMKGGNL